MEPSSSKVQPHGSDNNKKKLSESSVFGVTKSESTKGSLSWKIVRFKDLDKRVGEYCESPEFTVGDHKWSLFLYPNGSKDDAKNYISIFLSCLNIFQEVTINFTVTFLAQNNGGDKVLGPIKKTFGEDELDWGWSKALDHPSMNMCFLAEEDGALFIKCDVEVFGEWRTTLETSTTIRVPDCTIHDDFEKLLNDSAHSDVKFIVGDQQFKAHRGILSVRSSVFRGMFASDMREGREGIVTVGEVDSVVFKEMLKYIYTGSCSKLLEDRPLDILTVADKYDLPRLKLMSEDILFRRLTMLTAPSTLAHADMYHAEQLKQSVLEFMATRFLDMIRMEGFKEWTLENPHLINEIHEHMARRAGEKGETTGPKSKKSSQKRRKTST